MASNKENVIFILDVRRSNEDDFKQKTVKCCADVIKHKICCGKKDEISFILVGTECTKNRLNCGDPDEDYGNICQYGDDVMYTPTWHLLMNFYQFVNESSCKCGDWVEALIVAMSLIKLANESRNVKHSRIVLFYNFAKGQSSFNDYNILTENLLQNEVDLIVVSPDIVYIDDECDQTPRAIFRPGAKSASQLENEQHVVNMISSCNAKLCNFNEALQTILIVKNHRPWVWNCYLRIGTEISIAVCGIIKAKNESNIKLSMVWNEPTEKLSREWGYFIEGNQITPEEGALIDGYMLGGTAIPYYDTVNDDHLRLPKGLTFMGFIPLSLVYEEYFSGESTYLILHQRGMSASARKLDALVRVLLKQNLAILCWKVYSDKLNKPKIVVLIPNQLHSDSPANFSMLEMAHHAQYHFFEFPKLTTKNTECSQDQLNAIDKLIDSMDLSLHPKDVTAPRNTVEKDILPFNSLDNIFEHNFMNIMERNIIDKASEDEEIFEEMLNDKNFVEKFWKLPEAIEEQAKEAAKEVKRNFPLQVNTEWFERSEANRKNKATPQSGCDGNIAKTIPDVATPLDINSLTWDNPAKDFELLLQRKVFPIKDHSERDFEFECYTVTYRNVLWKLIFEGKSEKMDSLIEAIQVFRKRCFDFNTFNIYNKWISSVRAEVQKQCLTEFWHEIIVKNDLGLCFIGEPSLEEAQKSKEFYNLDMNDYKKLC